MATLRDEVEGWLERARQAMRDGVFDEADLERLAFTLRETPRPRQRLLYLHADSPGIYSAVIAMAQHEPTPGHTVELRTDGGWPYRSVHDAIIDGWRVVQFPDQRAPFDDGEIDVLGYEFILEKWEE